MANLYVVGIGPGSEAAMTGDAKRAIEKAEIVGGYTVYIEQVRKIFFDTDDQRNRPMPPCARICRGGKDLRDGLQR